MAIEPKCSLCQAPLVREENVVVTVGSVTLAYRFAWVCPQCSAAFPIAIETPGLMASWETHRPKYGRDT